MKRIILAVTMAASVALAEARADGTPKIQFEQTVFDFGTLAEGVTTPGKFVFRNAGDGVLKVGTPDPSCGCTLVTVKPDTLKPGEKGEIAFTLDLTDARGPQLKHITVPSNDPQQPAVKLVVKGESKALYEISPELVLFASVAPGETLSETVRVKRLDGKKLQIGKVEASQDFLKVKVEPEKDSNGQAARLMIDATGASQPEQFSDIVTVYLQNSTKPAFHVPVAGKFPGNLTIEPEKLVWKIPHPKDWPGPNPEATTTRKILITSNRLDQPLDIGNLGSTFEDLLVKVEELEQGKKFEITVKLPQALQQSKQGILSFDTNFRDQPTVEIPFLIGVSKP